MTVPKWYVDDSKPWFKKYQDGVPKHPEFPVISLTKRLKNLPRISVCISQKHL